MKDPAVLFYTADFIAGTITMTDEQRGQYIMLLCLQHQRGFLTEKDMIKICGSYDEDIWRKFTKDGDKYYNVRMKTEAEKRKKYAESRSENRKGKVKDKKDMNNISKSYDSHMVNENINENIIIIKDKFESFRKKYPGIKLGAETELKNFQKHNDWRDVINNLQSIIDDQISYRKAKKQRGEFVPEWKNLKTWINQRCWEEEIEPIRFEPQSRFQS